MMQNWCAEAIRFMRNASEFGQHYALLTSELLPYLPLNGHICDAGCGLGYLSIELAKHCQRVTAIDRSESALSVLREKQLPENLQIVCGDVYSMRTQFDAMVLCYFGQTEEILRLASRCDGNMIVVRRDCSQHRFSFGEVKRKQQCASDLRNVLLQRGVPFAAKSLHIELGQPFVSIDDAITFFRLYNKSEQSVEREAVIRRIVETGREDYPWYLPGQRDMELTVFRADQVR